MMGHMELFVKSKESEGKESEGVECLGVFSRNESIMPCPWYRRAVQKYYDDLVSRGMVSFIKKDIIGNEAYLLFKIKGSEGIEEIYKVSNFHQIDKAAIEDLLNRVAEINNIAKDTRFDPNSNTYLYNAVPALCFAAAIALYPVTGVPLAAAVGLTQVAIIAEIASINNDIKTKTPKPSL